MNQPLLAIPVRRDIDEQMTETRVVLLDHVAAHDLLGWISLAEELTEHRVVEFRAEASYLLQRADLYPADSGPWAKALLDEGRPAVLVETEEGLPEPLGQTAGLWVQVQQSGYLNLEAQDSRTGKTLLSEDLGSGDLDGILMQVPAPT